MARQLRTGLIAFLALTVVVGLIYPLLVTGIGQLAFNDQADGSLLEHGGSIVGSSLIGQRVTTPGYFHPRPSAAGDGYDAMASSASNLGPTNPVLLQGVIAAQSVYRRQNELAGGASVPIDAVTASGSGLDPHISPANARLQAARVAGARGLALSRVLALVDEHTSGRGLGFLGEPGVNVLELNLAVDQIRQ